MTKVVTTIGLVYEGQANAIALGKYDLPSSFAARVFQLEGELTAKVDAFEKARLAKLDRYHKTEPDPDRPGKTRKAYAKRDGKQTPVPEFVDGGLMAYNDEITAMNESEVEVEATLLDFQDFMNMDKIKPEIMRGLRPFIKKATTKATQPVAKPGVEKLADAASEVALPRQTAGARPPRPAAPASE